MTIDRRKVLGLLGLSGAAAGEAAAATVKGLHDGPVRFEHGVASGDPLQDRVILWTRVTAPDAKLPVGVRWDVAIDPDFKTIVRQGHATTDAGRDHTVKVDVTGLKPGTEYHYRFRASRAGEAVGEAVIGRTRTLPAGATKDVVLAVTSCSLYPNGYFNAYDAIAKLARVDAVLHLGDYIYEYGAAPGDYGMNSPTAKTRSPLPPHEIVTLADYRQRHAQYKSDPMLQAAHARAPWIVVWDDHETANDSWIGGAENHQPNEGDWATRKAAALKAYYEWMPIREAAAGTLPEAAWRDFQFGDVATLLMTETRLTGRTAALDYGTDMPIVDGKPDVAAFVAKWKDPSRRMMGVDQERWLAGQVQASVKAGTAWQVLGNQVVMARVATPNLKTTMGDEKFAALFAQLPDYAKEPVARSVSMSAYDIPSNLDAWDGYPADRQRVYDIFTAAKAQPIVLAGDSHMFWVNELWNDAGDKRVAAEFGATSITSPGYGDILPGAPIGEAFVQRNKEVRYSHGSAKGFVLLTLERGKATGELVTVSTILDPKYETSVLKRFVVTPAADGGVEALKEG
ncbi:alkaline phosphatase [Caulobacter segnis]|uniref:Alkaline phosphatase n=2 Tax=Caulobacter segnis TaxID=88688 RepID=D5VHQ0_CAUST|nr:alkaline phosphatase D family protein [Caulobacter segnis]ADG09031.1 Alkaline phosphatase [Caulobacter segnis ATCC 21756]AVQ00859.1 alkaline phosphatase [Caulobacter segnis]